ncbi:MAG: hypothetical protein ACPGPR_02165 [Paracoccaceae bacterium]
MSDESQSSVNIARNKILQEMGELSFQDALSDVNERLIKEKKKLTRLALLSAKSWILRNKLHSALHDPYIYSISEVENTDIFEDYEEAEDSAIDNLFDDDVEHSVEDVKIEILKNTSINGHKVLKGTVVTVTSEQADKLAAEGKAKIVSE